MEGKITEKASASVGTPPHNSLAALAISGQSLSPVLTVSDSLNHQSETPLQDNSYGRWGAGGTTMADVWKQCRCHGGGDKFGDYPKPIKTYEWRLAIPEIDFHRFC